MSLRAVRIYRLMVFGFFFIAVSHSEILDASDENRSVCCTCHKDYRSLIPSGHPAHEDQRVPPCLSCHKSEIPGKALPNRFSSLLHLGHAKHADCLDCHTWKEGGTFDLPPPGGVLGKPSGEEMHRIKEVFTTWVESSYLDAIHAARAVTCSGCHGKKLPLMDDTVENERCLACHGPIEKLAEMTRPQQFQDRNPHQSHLGDIACTVCHRGHMESEVYCLRCHGIFKMEIPGGS